MAALKLTVTGGLDLLPPLQGWDSSVSYPAQLITAAVTVRVC